MIKIKKFVVNPLRENSFILYDDSRKCILIDPGFYFEEELHEVAHFINDNQLKPVRLINTHCHFDHLMGVEYIRERYSLPFECHRDDLFLLERANQQAVEFGFNIPPVRYPDSFLKDGDLIEWGDSVLQVIHVPGHSPGHVVFYSASDGIIIGGDVLFAGSIGRTDLPGGSYDQLIDAIKRKLLPLPGNTKVFAGHGPETTIGFERLNNPFLN